MNSPEMLKEFFKHARGLFGRMTSEQVQGCERIVECGFKNGTSRLHLAYILATVFHETGKWMVPLREGATRFGPTYSHESAVRAVKSLFDRKIISENYGAEVPPYNKSYYGRGLVQITWFENYKKFGIAENPEQALEWETALFILFTGMRNGMFTGRSLDILKSKKGFVKARVIVNGDVYVNGQKIAEYAEVFYKALKKYNPKKNKE